MQYICIGVDLSSNGEASSTAVPRKERSHDPNFRNDVIEHRPLYVGRVVRHNSTAPVDPLFIWILH